MDTGPMKKRSRKATRKLIKKLFMTWVKRTGAGWYHIKVDIVDGQDLPDALMDCAPSWMYMRATIRINLDEACKCTEEELEFSVVHELMHVFLDELNAKHDHEERVATQLAHGMIFVRNFARQEGNK